MPVTAPVDDRAVDEARAYDRWFDRAWGRYSSSVEQRALRRAVGSVVGRSVVAGDALALPFRHASFDLVVAITALEFVADPATAVAELARVARPGGRLLIGALNTHSPWGLAHRHEFTEPPWNTARFLTRHELRHLGAPYGITRLAAALHAPGPFPGLRIVGPVLELLGRAAPTFGAFQILVVDRS